MHIPCPKSLLYHFQDCPALPGPGDKLLDRVVELLELESRFIVLTLSVPVLSCGPTLTPATRCSERQSLLSLLLLDLVDLIGPGVARWVPRLARLLASCPYPDLLLLLPPLAHFCPAPLARELPTLLPALLGRLHAISQEKVKELAPMASALSCLVTTDLEQARLLCAGLGEVRVNPAFDEVVRQLELCT